MNEKEGKLLLWKYEKREQKILSSPVFKLPKLSNIYINLTTWSKNYYSFIFK